MTSRRCTRSNQHWNHVEYVNVEIYNVEQHQVKAVYFNVDVNNVRQRINNLVIFNVEFHNDDQRRNNVVNMTIFKKLKIAKKYFWPSKKMTRLITNTSFWLWSIKKKVEHWTYNVKINAWRYNAWYRKII